MFRSERFKIKVYIDIRHNNTSSILIKQSCLLKILWLKKVIPTKSYSLAMLPLLTQNIHIMHNPDFSQALVFILYLFKPFNFYAIHEREPWIKHYGWNREVVVEKTKRREIVSHQLGVSTGYGNAHQ